MSGTFAEHKSGERKSLDLLIRLYPEFPKGRILPAESPDFIISSGDRRLTGIELTRFTRAHPESFNAASHFTPELSREALLEVVQAKEKKLHLYLRHKLQAIWLLILVSKISQSSSFNIRNQLSNWHIQSAFDRVLLLDLSREVIYDVLAN
jgi:hypothetical protein